MRALDLPRRVLVTAPLALSLFSSLVQSAPSVNVALKASFSSAPYLVELLYAILPSTLYSLSCLMSL